MARMLVRVGPAFLAVLASAASVAACGDDSEELREQLSALQTQVFAPTTPPEPTATPGPDVVVGVSWRCDVYVVGAGGGGPYAQVGESCTVRYQSNYVSEIQKTTVIQNIIADVTVRTSGGNAYHANVSDPPRRISIGDRWPPE